MEPYGLGGRGLMENLEIIQQTIDLFQSQHLQEEPIGNKLLVENSM
jgi:hypothetical protein